MTSTKVSFSSDARREAESLMGKYPDKGAALLPVLHIAQREFGHISPEVEEYVAEFMGLTKMRVRGVVTFYTMYRKRKTGKYLVQVCTNISCSLLGAEDILKYIERKLGVSAGETSADGRYTLVAVECLGSCGAAPAMQLNDDYYEKLTKEKIDAILKDLK